MKIFIILAMVLNVFLMTHSSKEEVQINFGTDDYENTKTTVEKILLVEPEDIKFQLTQDPVGQMKINEFVKEQGSCKKYEVKDNEARIVPLFTTFNYQEPKWQEEDILIELTEEEAINLYLFSKFYKDAVDEYPGKDDDGYCQRTYEYNSMDEHKMAMVQINETAEKENLIFEIKELRQKCAKQEKLLEQQNEQYAASYYLVGQEDVCEIQITDRDECIHAVKVTNVQQGNVAARPLIASEWAWVSPSCSVQTGIRNRVHGDWTIYLNSRTIPIDRNHATYTKNFYTQVCKHKKNSIDQNIYELRIDACKAIRSVDFSKNPLVIPQVHATHMKMIMEFVNTKNGIPPPEEGYVKGLSPYIKGSRNSNTCARNSTPLTLSECKSAAESFRMNFSTASRWSTSPKGCLTSEWDGRQVFYNYHETGSPHTDQATICGKTSDIVIELGYGMSSPEDFDVKFVNEIWDHNKNDVSYVLNAAMYLEINSLSQLMGIRIGQEIMSSRGFQDLEFLLGVTLENEFLRN